MASVRPSGWPADHWPSGRVQIFNVAIFSEIICLILVKRSVMVLLSPAVPVHTTVGDLDDTSRLRL